jgi:hypothetical protein
MSRELPGRPRQIPLEPTVAWFLGDLIPDKLWDEFDIGSMHSKQISDVQTALFKHGGAAAWLRFIEQTRAALPQLLRVSLFEMIGSAFDKHRTWPAEIALHCRPVVSAYAGGRMLNPSIVLNCHVRLSFGCAGELLESSGDYVLAESDLVLRHERQLVIDRLRGAYYIGVPDLQAQDSATAAKANWFAGFGARRCV